MANYKKEASPKIRRGQSFVIYKRSEPIFRISPIEDGTWEEVVDFVFDTIADTMKRGDEVSIAGFGSFVVKNRKARQARNPKTGATVNVPAMKVPKFKAGKGLKDAVR